MADLKAGTTIGGTLVWTQGNFPLFPTGNTLLYKSFKVYTENDKPQADDNDFVSKLKGGTYTGNVRFNSTIRFTGFLPGTPADQQSGISLHNVDDAKGVPNFGMYFGDTLNHGTHGSVSGIGTDPKAMYWRTGAAGGWIFKFVDKPVASINTDGTGAFNAVNIDKDPTIASHATRKSYVDTQVTSLTTLANTKVAKSGDTMTGNLTAPRIFVNNIATANNEVPQLSQVVAKGVILDYGTF